jgi:hypothetical protein
MLRSSFGVAEVACASRLSSCEKFKSSGSICTMGSGHDDSGADRNLGPYHQSEFVEISRGVRPRESMSAGLISPLMCLQFRSDDNS